jgi:hypothetical protein|tara:strand:+ start:201 stop:512 length:312 start_codon:yes stop_codon:yes gene_type:complete
MNVSKTNEYYDFKESPKKHFDQLELDFKYHCHIIFKPNNQVLFEIAGDTREECRANAERVVMTLLSDWDALSYHQKESASPYVRHLVAMLNLNKWDHLEYLIA